MTNNVITNKVTLFICLFSILNSAGAEDITIEHLVPAGFSAADESNARQLLGILDGKPYPVRCSSLKNNSS